MCPKLILCFLQMLIIPSGIALSASLPPSQALNPSGEFCVLFPPSDALVKPSGGVCAAQFSEHVFLPPCPPSFSEHVVLSLSSWNTAPPWFYLLLVCPLSPVSCGIFFSSVLQSPGWVLGPRLCFPLPPSVSALSLLALRAMHVPIAPVCVSPGFLRELQLAYMVTWRPTWEVLHLWGNVQNNP